MKAMVLRRAGRAEDRLLELRTISDPVPSEGQVVLDVEACGVCRTDLHIAEGEVSAQLPIVPGHQVVGRVAAAGPGVKDLKAGDRVGVGWLFSTCGHCRFCRTGRENLCLKARFTGRDENGGFAGRLAADTRFIYPLPEALSAIEAAPLLCAGIIGFRSLRLSGITPGGRLGLIGFGASAHLAIQVAVYWGCDVYAFDRSESHRRLAVEKGARWAGGIDENPPAPLDAAITFAPAGELVPRALELLDRGGTLAINAIHMSSIPTFEYEKIYGERTVRSVMNYTRRDAEEFLELAAEIPVRAEIERFPLERAGDALLRVQRGDVRGAAVLAIGEEARNGVKPPSP
jgi:alcohol dehydrogenase, propanol-preferring